MRFDLLATYYERMVVREEKNRVPINAVVNIFTEDINRASRQILDNIIIIEYDIRMMRSSKEIFFYLLWNRRGFIK